LIYLWRTLTFVLTTVRSHFKGKMPFVCVSVVSQMGTRGNVV